jgi:23S rRNA pseudouridine955/2504/2580 synthase
MKPGADTIGPFASQCRRRAKYSKMNALSTKAEATPAGRRTPGNRPAVRRLEVDEDAGGGQRLDNYLMRHCKGVPKSHLYQLIRSGQVRVNGKRCRPDDRLSVGDVVRVPPVVTAQSAQSAHQALGEGADRVSGAFGPRGVPPAQFAVLYEDEAMLAIDKPAGVAVHGGSGVAHGAIERLRAARPQAKFLELAHRLDRETSGVLLLGKKRAALLALHAQLRERVADKRYLAIVVGRWPLRTKTVQQPLHRFLTPEGERRVRVQAGGQEALTRVTGLEQFELPGIGVFTLVEAKIETGRTHQIRVHLAHAGFPIVGDEKYGDFALNKLLDKTCHKRMFLHAISMKFRHPIDGRTITLEAPLPDEFRELMAAGHSIGRSSRPDVGTQRQDESRQ